MDGDTVKKGDVIMIIESMKLMNEVQSDFSGTVKKILVNNGDAVEFDPANHDNRIIQDRRYFYYVRSTYE